MTDPLPNTPPLDDTRLDRYEALLDRAARQHHDQVDAARALVRESVQAQQALTKIRADADDSGEQLRMACLDAAAQFMGPFMASCASSIIDEPMTDDAEDTTDVEAMKITIREYWLEAASEAEQYVRSGQIPNTTDQLDERATLIGALNEACDVIAAVGGGDWGSQSPEWLARVQKLHAAVAETLGTPRAGVPDAPVLVDDGAPAT